MENTADSPNFWKKWGQTWLRLIKDPAGFFQSISIDNGYSEPILFALVVILGTSLASMLINVFGAGIMAVGIGFVSIIVGFAGLFISAGITHLFVMLVGGKSGFEATFKVIAYGQAVSIFAVIPIAGAIVAFFWSLVLYCIGIKTVHNLSMGKAILAVVAPVVIGILIGIGFAMIMAVVYAGAQ